MTAPWLTRMQGVLGGALNGALKAGHARRLVRVAQVLPLGPGSRLIVVDFAGQRLLLGQARGGLVRLADAEAVPPQGGGEAL